MTVHKNAIQIHRYIGDSSDVKPTKATHDTPNGSTFFEHDTGIMWLTHDGTTWVKVDRRVQLVESDGTVIDLPTELAAIEAAIGVIGSDEVAAGAVGNVTGKLRKLSNDFASMLNRYGQVTETPAQFTLLRRLKDLDHAFSMGGVNFDDYSLIKTLWLPSNASTTHVNLQFEGVDYVIPGNSIFIGLKISGYIFPGNGQTFAFFGEGLVADNIVQHVLSFSDGTEKCFMKDVMGVFGAGDNKYIKGGTDNGSVNLFANSALYGVEVVVS